MADGQGEAELSPATCIATGFFGFLRWLSFWAILRFFLKKKHPKFLFRGEFTKEQAADTAFSIKRSKAVDWYVLFWTAGSAAALAYVCLSDIGIPAHFVFWAFAFIRLLELIQAPLNTLIFDIHRGRTDSNVASSSRLLVLSTLNAAEFATWFAVLYALDLPALCGASAKLDAFYFSIATQFTVGYGDIHPLGGLRLLTVVQIVGGFILAVVVLARAVTTLPPMRGLLDPVSEKKSGS